MKKILLFTFISVLSLSLLAQGSFGDKVKQTQPAQPKKGWAEKVEKMDTSKPKKGWAGKIEKKTQEGPKNSQGPVVLNPPPKPNGPVITDGDDRPKYKKKWKRHGPPSHAPAWGRRRKDGTEDEYEGKKKEWKEKKDKDDDDDKDKNWGDRAKKNEEKKGWGDKVKKNKKE